MSQQPEGNDPYTVGIERNMRIIVTTTNEIEGGRVVEYLGIVRGVVVREVTFEQSCEENAGYVQVSEAARHEAYSKMLQHAEQIGAHAILGMRYDTSEFSEEVNEVLAYGTAVRLEPISRT